MDHTCEEEYYAQTLDLHPARLLDLLSSSELRGAAVVLERTVSTNSDAVAAARVGAPEGTILTALEQSGGRGRRGRRWFSARGLSLVFSMVLRPTGDFEELTALLALSAASALDKVCSGIMIKWPNDLYIGGKKLGGILAEAGEGYVVLGMGINVNEKESDFSEEISDEAVSLRTATGKLYDRGIVLKLIMESFGRHYISWGRTGFSVYAAGMEERLLYKGEEVTIYRSGEIISGKLVGVDEKGFARIGTDGGERVLSTGDLTLRRADV